MKITRAEYEELKRQHEELTEKLKIVEIEKFEVKVPKSFENYWMVYEDGSVDWIGGENWYDEYKQGLVFKTKEEAERYVKERDLLTRIKHWAEIHNKPTEKDCYLRWEITRASGKVYIKDLDEEIWGYGFCKLPCFYSYETAQACIDEFGDEIVEVMC